MWREELSSVDVGEEEQKLLSPLFGPTLGDVYVKFTTPPKSNQPPVLSSFQLQSRKGRDWMCGKIGSSTRGQSFLLPLRQ